MNKRLFALILTMSLACAAFAQKFEAQVENLGKYYRLSFTVASKDAEHFTPPSLADFEVLSGPAQSSYSSVQFVNGKVSHSESLSFTYIIRPKKNGHITIGPASVSVGGKTLRSNSVSLTATQASQSSGGRSGKNQSGGMVESSGVQQSGTPVTKRDLFIDVTPTRTTVYEQEAVLLTYRIHVRLGVGLANTTLTRRPDFKNLISQEIPIPGNEIQMSMEYLNGATYRTGTILQYLVFPQKAGALTIPGLSFDCTVIQQDNSLDFADAFFNGGGSIGVQVQRSVKPLTLTVKELPKPKPAAFSGGVGRFSVKGELLSPELRTNEPCTYRITVEGTGNMKLIATPSVTFPKDFDVYDPKTEEQTEATSEGLKGKLTFDYTFVPHNKGDYEIPAVDFVYFSPEENRYVTLSTKPTKLHVLQGTRSAEDAEREMELRNSDIRPIIAEADAQSESVLAWGSLIYWILHLLLAFIAFVVIKAVRKYMAAEADTVGRKRSKAVRTARKRIDAARKQLQAGEAVPAIGALRQALTGYVADTFNRAESELTIEAMTQLLQTKGIAQDTIERFAKMIADCDFARYAPQAQAATMAEELFAEADKIMNELA